MSALILKSNELRHEDGGLNKAKSVFHTLLAMLASCYVSVRVCKKHTPHLSVTSSIRQRTQALLIIIADNVMWVCHTAHCATCSAQTAAVKMCNYLT